MAPNSTSRQRILAAWNGEAVDHIPLTTWCFGFPAIPTLRWERDGKPVNYWYSKRLEHIHLLPQDWTLEDDFKRVLAWRSLDVDDVLDVSVPWSISPEITYKDTRIAIGNPGGDLQYPVLVRDYQTPVGFLRHAVRQTGEHQSEGWIIQPEVVPLFDDFNIPRGVKHAVISPTDIPKIRYLYQKPDAEACNWFANRMKHVKNFADQNEVAVQAWSAFGMDAVIWLMGTEGAIIMAMEDPTSFGQLVDIIAEVDLARVELAAATPGVDMIMQRGWYSSTDFWSVKLFDKFVVPHLKECTAIAHKYGKKFGYTMTTGGWLLGTRMADAGVDVLFGIDPVLDKAPLEKFRDALGDRMTMVGGANSMTLASGNKQKIHSEIQHAIEILGPTHRFILHPIDALFPDTPHRGVEEMIEAWHKYR